MSRIQEADPLPRPAAVAPTDLGGPPAGTALCDVADLADKEAVTVAFGTPPHEREIFIRQEGDKIVAYENNCPHFNMPLNLRPNKFLNYRGDRFLCVNHYAIFQIEDGYCEAGPCEGHWLTPVKVHVREGKVLAG